MTAPDTSSPTKTAPLTASSDITLDPSSRGVLLLWAVSLLPLLLFGVVAIDQRAEALREGEAAVARTIQVLEEHALRVFEAQQLIIDRTDQYLGEMAWDEIRSSEEVHRFLQRAAAASPHVDGLWLVPPDGRTANSADFFPFPDISVADRSYFQALRERNELHFGEMILGRTKGTFNFNLSRRRSPGDSFDGLILVTSSLTYFTNFWEQMNTGPFVAGIFREDGEILVRYPIIDGLPRRLPQDSPMRERMMERDDEVYPSTSSLDELDRIYGYSRIGETPLFIGYGVPNSEILGFWRSEMLRLGLIALMASALLVIGTTMITRKNRHLGATAVAWRRTAEALELEVDRRLRAEDVAAERKRLLDEVRVLTAQRQSILENMAEGVIAVDSEGYIIYANREATKLLGPFKQDQQKFQSLVTSGRISAADGSDLEQADAPHQAPLRGEDLPESEFLIRTGEGHDAVCSFRGGAIFGVDGQAEGAVLTFWDISERKREAERRQLLTRELDHRVRNMLAMIMAMMRISNEPRQSKEAFVAALSGRISAMARTHGVLSEGEWKGATIGRLVDDEVANAADARQLALTGDREVILAPKEAADLALALHELATNATKHGAWSVAEGCVDLRWEIETSAVGAVLRIKWKETGGPAIETLPERTGFGSTLLKAIFTESGMSLDYEPDGLHCTLTVPIQHRLTRGKDAETQNGDLAVTDGAPSLKGIRVLVVEDEALVRLDLVQMLREAGAIAVAEAGALEDAIQKAETARVDAAILDRNLNGESSLPLARLLARRNIPIVFVSGYSADDRGYEVDGHDQAHLQKPVSPTALLTALACAVKSGGNRD